MVQPSRPVDGDIRLMVGELAGCVKGGSCIQRAVVVEAVEDRAVVASIVSICLAVGIPRVVRRSDPKRRDSAMVKQD